MKSLCIEHVTSTDIIAMVFMTSLCYECRSYHIFPGFQGARGSRSYMAPEMLAGEGYAFPADMWPSCDFGVKGGGFDREPTPEKASRIRVDFKQLHVLE